MHTRGHGCIASAACGPRARARATTARCHAAQAALQRPWQHVWPRPPALALTWLCCRSPEMRRRARLSLNYVMDAAVGARAGEGATPGALQPPGGAAAEGHCAAGSEEVAWVDVRALAQAPGGRGTGRSGVRRDGGARGERVGGVSARHAPPVSLRSSAESVRPGCPCIGVLTHGADVPCCNLHVAAALLPRPRRRAVSQHLLSRRTVWAPVRVPGATGAGGRARRRPAAGRPGAEPGRRYAARRRRGRPGRVPAVPARAWRARGRARRCRARPGGAAAAPAADRARAAGRQRRGCGALRGVHPETHLCIPAVRALVQGPHAVLARR